MREAARWLRDRYPRAGVYLGVSEANAGARRFYEQLGARDEGATEKENPGSGSARVCRYVWDDPSALLHACLESDPR